MYKYILRERERERRAVPISTVGLELSPTQYSLGVELISHVEPTTRERQGEGGRETAGQDKTAVAERGKRQHYPQTQGYSLVFGRNDLRSHVKTLVSTVTSKYFSRSTCTWVGFRFYAFLSHLATLPAPFGALREGENECPREIIIRWLHCTADIWRSPSERAPLLPTRRRWRLKVV